MKLNYTSSELATWLSPRKILGTENRTIQFISTDTRTLFDETEGCFVALKGAFRSGDDFLEEAYNKGIKTFICTESPGIAHSDAVYIIVEDGLFALQRIAMNHRLNFKYPVVVIAGRKGKTSVKEWLYELLKSHFHVVRSPKSYNSQLGAALSLLELHESASIALIEVGLSKANELSSLLDMICPTHAIITSFYAEGDSLNQAFLNTIKHVPYLLIGEQPSWLSKDMTCDFIPNETPNYTLPFNDEPSIRLVSIAEHFAKLMGVSENTLAKEIPKLSRLALRLETFNGINDTLIINDTYNLELEALHFSLEYLASFGKERLRGVYLGLDEDSLLMRAQIESIIRPFQPDFFYIGLPENFPKEIPNGSIILVKGTRKAGVERYVARFREKQHQTKLEINLTALRHNVTQFKNLIAKPTKLLAMVKSQSYGSGLEKLAEFLQNQGVDYLGVAFTNEGVTLRKQGVKLPILVLNPAPSSYSDCIEFNLEPTLFTFNQLDTLIRVLIESGVQRFPIHVEVDTGMRRLGFEPKEIKSLLEVSQAQPEIYIKGVFSHFVESEEQMDRSFSLKQINEFQQVVELFKKHLSHPLICHMANSEGIVNYPEAHFDMVRLGLGMFGITHSKIKQQLKPVLSWKSVVSQVKNVLAGESISYARSFIAKNDMKIAIIPVGYGDGFPRALSNGKGRVRIQNQWCPIVGKVCMDMLMVDLGPMTQVVEGDEVIIFNDVDSLEQMALSLETIPYEVMTGISERVHRVYYSE